VSGRRVTPKTTTLSWLVGVALICGVGVGVVYQITVRTVPGRLLGDAALRGAALSRSHLTETVNATLDVITVGSLVGAIAVIAVIALIRMLRVVGLAAIGLLMAANLTTRILKSYLLSRPDLGLDESAPAGLNSLPGGHTTAAFSIVVALLFVVPPATRAATATVGALATSGVALATMSAGWHRAADSVAAFLVVVGWAAVAGIVVVWFDPDWVPRPPGRQPGRWLAVGAVGLLALFGALVVVLVADDEFRTSTIGPPTAFVAAGLLIVGSCVAATAAARRIVGRVASPSTPAGPILDDAEGVPTGPDPTQLSDG
jgi:membrane-associated phospholipid phosphatase